MSTFRVGVEKMLHVAGVIEVTAKNARDAEAVVQARIAHDELQTNSGDILWDDPSYEDCTFKTTGDVEEE